MRTQYERCGAAQIWREVGGRDHWLVCVLRKGHGGEHAAGEVVEVAAEGESR